MSNTSHAPIRRKPLSSSAGAQTVITVTQTLDREKEKIRESVALIAPESDDQTQTLSSKTTLSVQLLRLATFVLTFAALAVAGWTVFWTHRHGRDWTRSTVVGGNFSQTQAKVVDFLVSAIAAPSLLALFNYVVFQVARACVVDNRGRSEVFTLKELVEVGTTTFGSYDPFKLTTLLSTAKAGVVLLATAAILSAVSYSTLTNVIAYEAFQPTSSEHIEVGLDYLYRPPSSAGVFGANAAFISLQLPSIPNNNLWSKFTSQYFEVMAEVSYTTADSLLDDGRYIGVNATNASLSAVPSNVNELLDVPAYQLTYDCAPAYAHDINLIHDATKNGMTWIVLNLDVPGSPPNKSFTSMIRNAASGVDGFNSLSTFVAFDIGAGGDADVPYTFYLGVFGTPVDFTVDTTETAFGPIKHSSFNSTAFVHQLFGESGGDYTTMYGVACGINRQAGTVDLSRASNTSAWIRTSSKFAEDHSKLPLMMWDLQTFPNFVSPVPNQTPGIGGALAASANLTTGARPVNRTTDFEDFESVAKNYLYVEGESRRIAYEVAQSAPGQGGIPYRAQAAGTVLRYQIMFVPWILLAGLFTMGVAGLCVISLVFLTVGSFGARTGRIVSPVRLITDAIVGLPREEFEAVPAMTNPELEEWSRKLRVQYARDPMSGLKSLMELGPVSTSVERSPLREVQDE